MGFAADVFIRGAPSFICPPMNKYQLASISQWGANHFREREMKRVYLRCPGHLAVDRVGARARPSEAQIR